MAEHIFAIGSRKERIEAELKAYRANYDQYVRENHPQLFFVILNALMHEQRYATLILQSLFQEACSLLAQELSIWLEWWIKGKPHFFLDWKQANIVPIALIGKAC